MDKFKRKLEEKNSQLDKKKRSSQYFDGNLEGVEKKKAEREILLDQHKEIAPLLSLSNALKAYSKFFLEMILSLFIVQLRNSL